MFHLFVMLGTTLIAVEVLMLIFWGLYLVRQNVSIVDIGWGMGFILAALVDFSLGEGYLWRRVLVLTLVALWGMRLSIHLARRFVPDRDDPRYRIALERWPYSQHPNLQVLGLFLMQGLLITILSLPFALMNRDIIPFFFASEMFGLLVWVIGFIGESVADYQLCTFKNDTNNHGKVLCEGLWKYSRHPNYFFEWVIWIGYAIMAFSSSWGWLALISPILMLYLLRKVSGIPLTEEHALATKGDAYREYQRNTSAFFPWFSYPSCRI